VGLERPVRRGLFASVGMRAWELRVSEALEGARGLTGAPMACSTRDVVNAVG
jgi:hypothetical protein